MSEPKGDIRPDKLFQFRVFGLFRASFVLPFVHRAIHTSLKESFSWLVCTESNELKELVDIAIEVAPKEGRFAIGGSGSEFEFFTDEE